MKKNILGIVIVAIVVGFAFYSHFHSTKNSVAKEELVVNSTDGGAQLHIPYNVLPPGIKVEDIHVTLENNEVVSSTDPIIYNLEPNGLTFSAPVTLTITRDLKNEEWNIPLLVHRSGKGNDLTSEIIDNTLVTFDVPGHKMIASAQISHFSEVALWQVVGMFSGTGTSPTKEHVVGDSFLFSATIKPTGNTAIFKDKAESGVTPGTDYFTYAPGTKWFIDGKLTTNFTGVITPQVQNINPQDKSGLKFDQSGNVEATFTCAAEGKEYIRSGVNFDEQLTITYTVKHKRILPFGGKDEVIKDEEKKTTTRVLVSEEHTCKAKPTTTAAPTKKVIYYNGKYLPVDQLKVESEAGCGDDHYHAKTGSVISTDGTAVFDPGPQCGFGKVKDTPTLDK